MQLAGPKYFWYNAGMTIREFEKLNALRTDPEQMAASIRRLGEQMLEGWQSAASVFLPPLYLRIENIAICGMGGSHLGPDILRSTLGDALILPMTIVADYRLPLWVGEKTLVVCSSYSGGTEEVKAAMHEALMRGAKAVAMTSGGLLATAAKRSHVPLYLYQTDANPSGQPRLGIGYSIGVLMRCLVTLGLLKANDDTMTALAHHADLAVRRYGPTVAAGKNPAKVLALKMSEMIPLLIGAEWAAGNLHTWTNQIHENAKTFADWDMLPDANHHLLEGLRHKKINHLMYAVMVRDGAYHPRTKRRFFITEHLLAKAGIDHTVVQPHGETTLEKAIDLLVFGSYASWYMSLARRVAAGPIPTVNELKSRMARG